MRSTELQSSLPLPGYHSNLRAHLESTEPELWAWFAETLEPTVEDVDAAELELLKTTYRLDGDVFDVLTAEATLLAAGLGLENPITLHQQLHDAGRNARVQIFQDRVHVIFSGDILDLLDPGEQRAVLAHELAHVSLLIHDGGSYRVLDNLVHQLSDDPTRHDALEETARRFRLYTEVYADARAVQVTGRADDLISAVVKVESGLRNVDPAAYRKQAEEILLADDSAAAAWTHPELHIRVACLAANEAAGKGGASPQLLRSLIEGPDDLDRVDLLAQLRLQEITQRVLHAGRSVVGASAECASHIAAFTGINWAAAKIPDPVDDGELSDAEPSVRFLAASLLVDLALIEDSAAENPEDPPLEPDGLGGLANVGAEAERIGVSTEFDRILAKATQQTLAEIRSLRRKAQ